jgi:16S rRNA (cytosine967-C5)-methyltransferase
VIKIFFCGDFFGHEMRYAHTKRGAKKIKKSTAILFRSLSVLLSLLCVLLYTNMRYLWQHISTIISTYNGSEPLASFLKKYCRQYPILGSRDRRMLSTIGYSWHRCAGGISTTPAIDKSTPGFLENAVKSCLAWCQVSGKEYDRLFTNIPELPTVFSFDTASLFRHNIALSAGINRDEWLQSMLVQPQLFIRIRKDKDKILSLLSARQIPFEEIKDTCLALPNGSPIDTFLPPDSYVVQDASSQQTGEFFAAAAGEFWLDCCAGAGGKSLLLCDKNPSARLTVTDKRATIISNLKNRFRQYGLKLPDSHICDAANISELDTILRSRLFDNIICDAPCSGSGTWARTPEQLHFFDPASVEKFHTLQKSIALNVTKHLKPGGKLIYITCSVFRQENEAVTAEIANNSRLKVMQQQIINGTGIRADSMFVAVLQ